MPTLYPVDNANVRTTGILKCKYEPRGEAGLEGFTRDTKYRYQIVSRGFRKQVRVFHATGLHKTEDADHVPPIEIGMYYETVWFYGPHRFQKYFEILNPSKC